MTHNLSNSEQMGQHLELMKAAHIRNGAPSLSERRERLDAVIALLVDHQDALCEAVNSDYGNRSDQSTKLTDLVPAINALKFAKKHLPRWMKPAKRSAEFPLNMLGSKATLHYQPKGVVGIVAPWNFPISLIFSPLASALAAGNRAMVKPSEYTPKTSALMADLIGQYFEPDTVTAVIGDADIAATFTALPFDHLIFTGSTPVGRHVMRAASQNLTPVTLELGGKSPAVIGKSADLSKAATRIMQGKTLNAGQICVAPDYVFVPDGQQDAFRTAASQAVSSMYPSGFKDNEDYTSIINQRHFDRLRDLLSDAKSKGADIVPTMPVEEDLSQQPHRKMAPHLVFNPSEDMKVMQEEIFGPILPVLTYSSVDTAISYINAHPRPLALYYFGDDGPERSQVVHKTTAGGVTINDTIFHVAQDDLPFGGIGDSGMGNYHGHEGFLTFSHLKSVYNQTGSELIKIMRPPYGSQIRKQVQARLKK